MMICCGMTVKKIEKLGVGVRIMKEQSVKRRQ